MKEKTRRIAGGLAENLPQKKRAGLPPETKPKEANLPL